MKIQTIIGFIVLTIGVVIMCCSHPTSQPELAAQDTLQTSTPEQALTKLLAGNDRYVTGQSMHPRSDAERVSETSSHQSPFAGVVGCSDSRVPVELVFDQGVGDIFVIRTAGNNVNSEMVMGSVDYAVEHLGVKVLLVLGHGSCGGVTGAISENNEEHGNIGNLLDVIRKDISQYVGKSDSLDVAVRHHAQKQVERIVAYPHVAEKIQRGELIVKCAYYDVHTGKVTIE